MTSKAALTFGPVSNSIELFKEIADAVQVYLDMLYTCNPELVTAIFHDRAQLCTIENEAPLFRTVEEYREVVRARISPESLGAEREEHVVTIDLSSPTQAMIKVQMRVNQSVFSDYLTMFKLGKEWRIVAKTYYRVELS
ncbi:nuclear transport factor 2 family protein [Edaphobacter aggregans]|uniref:nuclear transport factor 2 family protein n=1 Tax=Edaphobacter aggregans TaxID=570835 RepID=UPI0014703703|nr:nuclear transport factor 2 family protein [Edaphobacter aggregans]